MMKRKNKICFLNFILAFSFISSAAFAASDVEMEVNKTDNSTYLNVAVIQGLNKSTAKTSTLEVPVGGKVKFGTLNILVHKCWQASLDQKPESKILLEVFEEKNEGKKIEEKRIFYGWMFASSPSISSLEHPIYDLTAIACKK